MSSASTGRPEGRGGGDAGDSGRRWYHPRPKPRRRTDLLGFNSTWWMAAAWLIVIVLVIYPYPGW